MANIYHGTRIRVTSIYQVQMGLEMRKILVIHY